jgi:hypothetical protein
MTGQISRALATRSDAADRDLDASIEYARKLSASELLPAAYQGKPQNVLVAIEYGRSVGIDPITAINMVHTIKGKPTASAQLMGALVRRAGHTLRVSYDGTTATAEIIRADDPSFTFRSVWTMDRAREAGLTGNATYKTFGPNMLKARAIAEVSRDACPEVLAGVSYLADELGGPAEIVAEQVTMPELAVTDDGHVADAETGELAFDVEVIES